MMLKNSLWLNLDVFIRITISVSRARNYISCVRAKLFTKPCDAYINAPVCNHNPFWPSLVQQIISGKDHTGMPHQKTEDAKLRPCEGNRLSVYAQTLSPVIQE